MDTANLLIMMHVLLLTYSGVSHTLQWYVGGTMDNLQISKLMAILKIGCTTCKMSVVTDTDDLAFCHRIAGAPP